MDKITTTLDRARIPAHVAIIMDGNRRWARSRGLPAVAGHKKGVETVRTVVKAASAAGIKVVTLYAFSTENWSRSKLEVNALMFLLEKAISDYERELESENVRLMVSGRLDALPGGVRKKIGEVAERLSRNTGLTLNIALNYGGRQEILDAVNAALDSDLEKVDEKTFSSLMYAPGLPDPDLLIRTSGERRISNFLLWQTAYSEFYITDTLWPDFGEKDLIQALLDYQSRDRRRGT